MTATLYEPPTYEHDPQAVLDYPIDWADYLDFLGATITSAAMKINGTQTATYPFTLDDLTIESFANTVATGTARISWTGTEIPSAKYPVTMHIVMSDGQEDDRTIYIKIKEK